MIRILVIAVVTFSMSAHSFAQEYTVLPYATRAKKQDGLRSHTLNFRIKIYGFGIKKVSGAGKGFDVDLGNGFVDPKECRLPVLSEVGGLSEIEPVEFQLDQLRKLKKKFISEVKEMVDVAEKLPDGSLHSDIQEELTSRIELLYEEKNKEAFDLFLPRQIEYWMQYKFRFDFRYSPYSTLSTDAIVTELSLSDEHLAEIKKIETASATRIQSLTKELDNQIAELKKQANEKLQGTLSGQQKKQLNVLLGKSN